MAQRRRAHTCASGIQLHKACAHLRTRSVLEHSHFVASRAQTQQVLREIVEELATSTARPHRSSSQGRTIRRTGRCARACNSVAQPFYVVGLGPPDASGANRHRLSDFFAAPPYAICLNSNGFEVFFAGVPAPTRTCAVAISRASNSTGCSRCRRGGDKQMFGANKQIPRARRSD